MVAALELRATKYTVFFIVSVGRTLLLSALVKLASKSPCEHHVDGPLVELVPIRQARDARKTHARFSVAIFTQSGHSSASSDRLCSCCRSRAAGK